MHPRTPMAMKVAWSLALIVVREVMKANVRQAAVMVAYLTLGRYEMAIPPKTCPQRMPPPTTDDCQPMAMTLVVYTVPIIVGQRTVML